MRASELDELAKLEANWDSYGALPISADAIEKARAILTNGIEIWPLVNGGVSIEIELGGFYVCFDIQADGTLKEKSR